MKVPVELVGCEVWRIVFDYQVRLLLSAAPGKEGGADNRVDAELVMESPFLLRDAAGKWHELVPGPARRALAPVLDLFGDTIATVDVDDRGALHLTFTSGSEVLIGPDAAYESWHLNGHGVDGITVGPGGHTDWSRTEPPNDDDNL